MAYGKTFNKSLSIIALGCSALLYSVTGCSRAPEAPPKEVADPGRRQNALRCDRVRSETRPENFGHAQERRHDAEIFDGTQFRHARSHCEHRATCTKFLDKASTEASHDYVPPGSKEVLAHTKLLGPGESDTVTFTAPYVPGEYLYLCSFPGHYSQGTKGFMTVK